MSCQPPVSGGRKALGRGHVDGDNSTIWGTWYWDSSSTLRERKKRVSCCASLAGGEKCRHVD